MGRAYNSSTRVVQAAFLRVYAHLDVAPRHIMLNEKVRQALRLKLLATLRFIPRLLSSSARRRSSQDRNDRAAALFCRAQPVHHPPMKFQSAQLRRITWAQTNATSPVHPTYPPPRPWWCNAGIASMNVLTRLLFANRPQLSADIVSQAFQGMNSLISTLGSA